jgi:hypothetical protein
MTRIPQIRRLKMLMRRAALIAALAATGISGFTEPAHAPSSSNYGNRESHDLGFANLPVPSHIYGHLAFPGPPRSRLEGEAGAIVGSTPPFGISNPNDPQWNPLLISAVSAILTFRSNANTEKEISVPLYQLQQVAPPARPIIFTTLEFLDQGLGLRYKVQLILDQQATEPTLVEIPPQQGSQFVLPKIKHNPEVWRFHRIRIEFNVIGQAGIIPVTFTDVLTPLMFPDWTP